MMTMSDIAVRRLHNQQLARHDFRAPGEVVAWLGAVQAQDYAGAKWALGLRLPGMTDADIDRACMDGAILRTHVMRPTWHFVLPADIRWMLDLTAPRVHAANVSMYRRLEIDDTLAHRSHATIANALRGGKQLTRAELGAVLQQAGIATDNLRLTLLAMRAELDGIICSGPRRGKQFTYMLLEERAPQASTLPRDEALAKLTRRYFTSHGPATADDFVWWSGLTKADARRGLDMVANDLMCETVNDQSYWFAAAVLPHEASQHACLLPTYDEYLFGYTDRSAILERLQLKKVDYGTITFNSMIVIGGQIAGVWRRAFKRNEVVIEKEWMTELTAVEVEAVAAAEKRFRDFLAGS